MNLGNNFIDIQTVFQQSTERTILALSKLYSDGTALRSAIRTIVGKHLSDDTVSGKRLLLKPNWVRHNKNADDEICLRTHDNFLLAALEVFLEMGPATVIIGDAPVQSCEWDKIVRPAFVDNTQKLSAKYQIPIIIEDFRRVTYNPNNNDLTLERRSLEDYLIFDLGKDSFLEPVSEAHQNKFRVTYYNPDRLAESHAPGMHKYCITRTLFDVDVVVSIPKVKTHQKAGITAALKNLVGVNGDKDYLPHHRIGGTGFGGDCYPGGNYLRYWAELLRDKANRNLGKRQYWFWFRLSSLFWKFSLPGSGYDLSASWYGNDTTWRMVLDLNKIVCFGRPDGTISDEPQRVLYSLSDGIIGGQGNGPLFPDPLPLGIISFSNQSSIHDVCMAILMGFDYERIPLLKSAALLSQTDKSTITLNGAATTYRDLQHYAVSTLPPPGWKKYLTGRN